MWQISSIRPFSPPLRPSAIPQSKTKSHEGAAFCSTFFFGNLGGKGKTGAHPSLQIKAERPVDERASFLEIRRADSQVPGATQKAGEEGEFEQRPLFSCCSSWALPTKKSPDAAPVMDTAQGERGVLPVAVGRSSACRPATDRGIDRFLPHVAHLPPK